MTEAPDNQDEEGISAADILGALEGHVIAVVTEWDHWKRLFASDRRVVTTLNGAAPLAFMVVQETLKNSVLNSVARLLQPRGSRRKRNLSVEALVVHSELRSVNLSCELQQVSEAVELLRVYRNKKIAHLDLDAEVNGAKFGRFTDIDIDSILQGVVSILQSARATLGGLAPDFSPRQIGGADDLIKVLGQRERSQPTVPGACPHIKHGSVIGDVEIGTSGKTEC